MTKDSNNIEKKKHWKDFGQGKSIPSTFEKENPTQIESTLPGVIFLFNGLCSLGRRLVVNSSSGWLIGLP